MLFWEVTTKYGRVVLSHKAAAFLRARFPEPGDTRAKWKFFANLNEWARRVIDARGDLRDVMVRYSQVQKWIGLSQ